MGLKLNLIVHGVPKGQKIWGPQEEDRIFIESFYSRKSTVDAQLQVDIMKIGNEVNCYFTYLRGGNILDIENRQGSYFALTIRINAFYIDLFNIYTILEASYQKFILGKIIKSDSSSSRFIVNDFQQCDNSFKTIEKEIINYLSSFSNSSDFISLNDFVFNSKLPYTNINLLECNSKSVFNYIKEKGNISISPLHPSRQFSEFSRKKEEELEKVKLETKKMIGEEKAKSEQQIQVIKAEYANADKKISELNKQLEIEKKNVVSLKDELKLMNQKVTEYDTLKQKIDSKEQEIKKIQTSLKTIRDAVNEIGGINIKSVDKKTENKQSKAKNEDSNYKWIMLNVILTVLILLAVLLFAVKPSILDRSKHGSLFENERNETTKVSSEFDKNKEILDHQELVDGPAKLTSRDNDNKPVEQAATPTIKPKTQNQQTTNNVINSTTKKSKTDSVKGN